MPDITALTGSRPDPEVFEAARALLAQVARGAPPGSRAEALAVLGWMAWWQGSGARGRLLIGLALADDPLTGWRPSSTNCWPMPCRPAGSCRCARRSPPAARARDDHFVDTGVTRRRACRTMTAGQERQRQAPARWPATLQPRWGAPGDDTADRRGGGGKRGPWWAPRFEEHTDELSPHRLTRTSPQSPLPARGRPTLRRGGGLRRAPGRRPVAAPFRPPSPRRRRRRHGGPVPAPRRTPEPCPRTARSADDENPTEEST